MNRTIYETLLRWKEDVHRKPLILTGARQTGKTWILKLFGERNFRAAHYVNFEDTAKYASLFSKGLAPSNIVSQLAVLLGRDVIPNQDLLIFDEIQQSSDALTSLKYFRENLPELAVVSAGSHIGLAVQQGSFPVGQVDFLTLYPLTFQEYLQASNPRAADFLENLSATEPLSDALHEVFWNELKTYYVVGGMPGVLSLWLETRHTPAMAFEKVRDAQASLARGYTADFAKHAGKVNATHIARLFDSIPVQLARTTEGGTSRFKFKDVIPGKSRFIQIEGPLDWLCKTGLTLKAAMVEKPELPLQAFARDNIFKLYLLDVGLLGCMAGLAPRDLLTQDFGTYKGWFAENFVAQELTATSRHPLFFWQGRQSEVEFLVTGGSGVIPVEVKSGRCIRSRSLAAFFEKCAPPFAIRLSARNLPSRQGRIVSLPLYLASRIDLWLSRPAETADLMRGQEGPAEPRSPL